MPTELNHAGQDADEAFWYNDVGSIVTPCSPNPPPTVVSNKKKHWVEIAMVDKEGNPVSAPYEITLPDGSVISGSLDERGIARIEGIDPGNCKVTFPGLDKSAYKKK